MTRQSVKAKSSNLVSIGYEASAKRLEIEFSDESIYQYENISEMLYAGLMGAPSHGVFFDANIKKKSFAFRCIQKGTPKVR